MSGILEVAREGRLLRIALNRPEKRNALSLRLCHELVEVTDRADNDPGIGAVLLESRGPVFCAGMDLAEMLEPDIDEMNRVHEQLFTTGSRITKPVVAAVRGAALAGGAGLVANCHVVVAAEDATFGLTEIRLGLWPFTIFRAVALAVGERRAVEWSLTGRIIDAAEAHACALVHHVAPAAEVEARAAAIATELSQVSLTAVRSGLYFVQETRGETWKEAGDIAARIRKQVFAGADLKEGVRAFHEKRAPLWPSHRASGAGGH